MSAPWTRFYEEGVPATIDYPSWTLPDLLDHSADEYPNQAALTFFVDPKLPPSRMTYRALRDATLRFATALYQLGVRKGDRVAIMLPNCPEFPIAFFGLLRLGAIAVNTNPLYVSRELKSQLNDSGSETIVLLDQFVPRLEEIGRDTKVKRVIVTDVAGSIGFPFRQLVHLVQRKHGEYVKVKAAPHIYHWKTLLGKHPPSPPQIEVAPGDVALFQYTG